MAKWETVSRSMFLMKRWKCCWDPVAVCVITKIKIMVFEGFRFFYSFIGLVSRGVVSGDILESFGDPGNSFSDF